jgi:hypothetical protein
MAHIHPCNHVPSLYPNLVSLHMNQVQLSGFDQRMMDLLTMGPCPIAPTGHRSFIQAKRMHNGLNRTSIGEQGHHDDNDLHRLA